jgi:hypothetical protein
MRCTSDGPSVLFTGVAALVLACGNAEGGDALFVPLEPPGQVRDFAPEMETVPLLPVDVPPSTPGSTPPEVTTPEMLAPASPPPAQGTGCRPALGVSGSPQNISEAIVLMNTLPKPTSLACFLEALDRPLTLYMTESGQSLQPSPGPRSPRTFILRGPFEMSIVLDGLARDTLELGFRPEIGRSIKAEILFPLTRDVNEATLFSRVQATPRTTICGACHVGEEHKDFPGFPEGVFESNVIDPYEMFEVAVDSMRTQVGPCDKATEPYRCGLLSGLFDHGDVIQGSLGVSR